MIQLSAFGKDDFERFISWIDSNELLVTIAGNYFAYPLTIDQLQKYLDDKSSYAFNILDTDENKIIGHAELIKVDAEEIKIDKLIIGDTSSRGKGLCKKIMHELLVHTFTILQATKVNLFVFEQNASAIRCYESAGFIIDRSRPMLFPVGNKKWTAFKMEINKSDWKKMS